MPVAFETKLDFDRSVNTEDRFAIRKVLDKFIYCVNNAQVDIYSAMLSDAAVVEGFSDIVQVKAGFVSMLSRRFLGNGKRTMRLPEVKLSYSRYLFQLKGTYEEISEGILSTEGTIEIFLIKEDQKYKIVRIIFYPRMMLSDEF
jgi:hypothetical protein